MERLKGAISFLTILPIRSNIEDEKEFSKIMAFFPIVALILGIIYCSISNLVYNFADSLFFSSVIYVLSSIIFTGGLHYDGLADACDGLFSGREKDKILEIMQDSRIGTFGVLGIIVNVLLKLGIVYIFIQYDILNFAIFSVIFSRTMQIIYAYFGNYPKKNGMGNFFVGKIGRGTLRLAVTLDIIIVLILSLFIRGYGFSFVLITFIISFIISFAIMFGIKHMIYKKIGGITGDILGFIAEISENIFMLVFFVVYNII
ncbi:MAG: adenosylcobinamide-GDP ribazoletransferase [Peptoanaerobacter stomatis]